MTVQIQTKVEGRRGCGYRKKGGLYLIAPSEGHSCCRLPHPLTVCPCCGGGIGFARGWTWVDADKLFFGGNDYQCVDDDHAVQLTCPLAGPGHIGRAGLIWVGKAHYRTAADFQAEASRMGISRRITAVPRGFKLGETWVLLAHLRCVPELTQERGELLPTTKYGPGIFTVFKPTAVEYVVRGDEGDEELERLAERGITPVKVVNPKAAPKAPVIPK